MAEIYNTDRFGELYYASQKPDLENLGLASRYISTVLERAGIQYLMIGGWAILLRGSGRETQDVDVAVSTNMDYLKRVLTIDSRICFPAIHGQTSVQIFVHTGHTYDTDYPLAKDLAVSMDLVISGNLGTPSDLGIASEPIVPAVNTPLGDSAVVLHLLPQISAKLGAFADRGSAESNDFRDLVFLLTKYGAQAATFSHLLDPTHRQMLVQMLITRLGVDSEITRYIRQVLNL